MLLKQSGAYELNAVLIEPTASPFCVREENSPGCHPKPPRHSRTGLQVAGQLRHGSLPLPNDRTDLVSPRGMRLEANDLPACAVAEQIVPSILLVVPGPHCLV